MYISKPVNGRIYVAQPSVKYNKYIWQVVPVAPTGGFERIAARLVPKRIRKRAYNMFDADRRREHEARAAAIARTPAPARPVERVAPASTTAQAAA
jgi:hypothetical protein